MKDYSGNRAPFLYALFQEKDREKVMPTLEAIAGKGFRMCGVNRRNLRAAGKAVAVLVFLSESFAGDSAVQDDFFAVLNSGVPMIPVQLDSAAMPEVMTQAMYARNSIVAERYPTAEALAERILTAEAFAKPVVTAAQKKLSRRNTMIVCAAAVVMLIAAAVLMWPRTSEEPVVQEVVVEEPILAFGMTQADLDKIRYVVMVGDEYTFERSEKKTCENFAWRMELQYEAKWMKNSTGEEVALKEYDLDFLPLLHNVQEIHMARVKADALPDLSGLDKLEMLSLQECDIPDISGVTGCPAYNMSFEGTTVRDFTPLTNCDRLRSLTIALGREPAKIFGIAPESLYDFHLKDNARMIQELDLSAMAACTGLRVVDIQGTACRNVDGLQKLTGLEQLYLFGMEMLSDISGISNMKMLGTLSITNDKYSNYSQIADLSPIGECTNLRFLDFTSRMASDLSPLGKLSKLTHLSFACPFQNLDFLWEIGTEHMDFLDPGGYGGVPGGDYSGLEALKSVGRLTIHLVGESFEELVAPYVQELEVTEELHLTNCSDLRMDRLPNAKQVRLVYCPVQTLEMLPESVNHLTLENMQSLPSLEGLNHDMQYLAVIGCSRLKDWSALNGHKVSKLIISGCRSTPDFGQVEVEESLTLESMVGMKNLQCLEAFPEGTNLPELRLPGLEKLENLAELEHLHGGKLAVPPHLDMDARKLVNSGNFSRSEVIYPEHTFPGSDTVMLESLEDLELLTDDELAQIEELCIAGGMVYDPSLYWVNSWNGQSTLVDSSTYEKTPAGAGIVQNLDMFQKLTGLRKLRLTGQPLQSLDGIQNFPKLEELECAYCSQLSDVSAAFTLDMLQSVNFQSSGVTSIQGVQNLTRLYSLNISETKVTDLSPLAELTSGGVPLNLYASSLHCADYTPLGAIKNYSCLEMGYCTITPEQAIALFESMKDCRIDYLSVSQSVPNQEALEVLAENLNGVSQLTMGYTTGVQDLSPLTKMENLTQLTVSDNMGSQLATLEGLDYRFAVQIW